MKPIKSKFKTGDKVIMVNCREAETKAGIEWECISEPWDCCGSEVIKLKGKAGGFATSCLKESERREKNETNII